MTLGEVLKEAIPIILISLLVTVALGRLAKRLNSLGFKAVYIMSWLATFWFILVFAVKAVQTWAIQ